jgi:hypothetical protein
VEVDGCRRNIWDVLLMLMCVCVCVWMWGG